MKNILIKIDDIIDGVFHLPKSQDADFILAELQDLREMVASKQSVQADGACEGCGLPPVQLHVKGCPFDTSAGG